MEEFLLTVAGSGKLVYALLFIALMGGAIGLPIPEDIPLIAAGVLVQRGEAQLLPALVVCYIAVLLGDLAVFGVGRIFGSRLLSSRWFARSARRIEVDKVRAHLERRSLITIFLARHLFYLRTVTFLACGMVRMNPLRFLAADAIAALISVPLVVGLGYFFSENLSALIGMVQEGQFYVLILTGCAVIALLILMFRRQNRPDSGGDPAAPFESTSQE